VISRHDEVKYVLRDLASKAFIPSVVRDEPLIHTSRPAVQMSDLDQPDPSVSCILHKGDDRGDVLIRGLWESGTDCIIDVRVTDLDAKSNISKDPAKVLAAHGKEKKRKYLEACLKQRHGLDGRTGTGSRSGQCTPMQIMDH
jgi:hypothetical protein